jgi:hypothetical protein
MINIHIRSLRPRCPIIRTVPSPADGGACGWILHHAGPVSLEHHFPGVAGPGLGAPMREEVAAVTGLATYGRDAEGGELGAGGGGGGDVGWGGSWEGDGGGIGGQ